MPLKLNVGLSKKIGQPNYGSLGASCHLEIELESSLIQNDLKAFHRHVKNAFIACRQSVLDELARNLNLPSTVSGAAEGSNGHSSNRISYANGSTSHENGNVDAEGNLPAANRASQKQLDFANQLAKKIRGLGERRLEDLADKLYGKPLAYLTTIDASGLIATLKAIKEDRITLEDALNGVPV